MSRQTDRERFLYQMAGLGVPLDVARKVLRHAATIQRCNEASCSYEWADHDRVECPGVKVADDCICDGSDEPCTCTKCNQCDGGRTVCQRCGKCARCEKHGDNCVGCQVSISQHSSVQRVERTAKRRENAIRTILAPFNLEPVFQGDPRGWCVRILRPTDRRGESYTDGIGVPA